MLWLALHLPRLSLEAFCATLPAEVVLAAPAPAQSAELEGRGRAGAGAPGAARVSAAGPSAAGPPAAGPSATSPATPRPVALVAEHRITAAQAAAAARGIRVGMKRATALALAPDLLLGEADATRDAAALTAVAHAALAFTPAVTLQDGQATVLMEVQASLRLFGGLPALQQRLREALVPLGHRVQMAAAGTALGAAVLARWGPRAAATTANFDPVLGPHATCLRELTRLLDRAPIWLLGPGREHWEALQGMGLTTLSDLRELPRAGLARRFGQGLLDDLDRAHGRAPDPRCWLELPTRFETRLELHERAEYAEQVLHAAAVLLARLVAWAQARQGRIAAFTLAMQHEPRHAQRGGAVPATELRIELAEPALDAAHLQLLLRERLAQCRLAAPTLELRLRCRDLVAAPPPNGELFPTHGSEALGLARLLERLRARLGDAQVQRLEPVADHRPERSTRGVPAVGGAKRGAMTSGKPKATRGVGTGSSADSASPVHVVSHEEERPLPPRPWPGDHMGDNENRPQQRPVWLLPDPVPLPERNALPLLDGQPLQLLSGPERIEAGWWDGAPATRDYFIALAADGSLVWVWRSRLPAAASAAGGRDAVQWMLQGRFG